MIRPYEFTIMTFHREIESELHFRFVGELEGRCFIVNVQFPALHEVTGERLKPQEYDIGITQILKFVIAQTVRDKPVQ
jgi:hypothetical protein